MTMKNKTSRIRKNELSDSQKKSMKARIITGIIGLLILVPAIFIGNWVYFGLMTVVMGIACYEILGCANKRNVPINFLITLEKEFPEKPPFVECLTNVN